MFNKIYRFLSRQVISTSVKGSCRVFPAKDLRQYNNEFITISHIHGSKWLFVNKFSKKSFKILPRLLHAPIIIVFLWAVYCVIVPIFL